MKIGIKVGDVMTRHFVAVSPEKSIIDCAKTMISKGVGSLIVKQDDKLLGILTEGDVIRAMAKKRGKHLDKIKVKDVMTKRLVTIRPDRDVYDALLLMKRKKVRWLPVTADKTAMGMLTIKDILRIEPSLFDIVSKFTPIREETAKVSRILRLRGKRGVEARGERWIKEGECQECGAYGVVYNVDGTFLCEDCRDRETRG